MEHEEAKSNKKLTLENFKIIYGKSLKYNVIIGFSYFIAYGISTYLLTMALDKIKWEEDMKKYAYNLAFLFLQIGIFVSSSSLEYIKIQKTYILTFV